VEARFSALVQTGPGAHPGVRCSGRNVHHPSQSSQSHLVNYQEEWFWQRATWRKMRCYSVGRGSTENRKGIQSRYLQFYTYKVRSKKHRTFTIKTLFYNILSTAPFKVVPSTGDTPFATFLPLLKCFLERNFCDGAQFSHRIFLNLRVFKKKKRPNFLNSSPTSKEGALRLLSAPSGRF
jgi:hypothetical protein